MGILSGALGGMGDALVNIGATNMKSELARENESALNEQRSKLDTNKQMALERFREGLRTAPLERLGNKAKEYAGQEVPVDAPAPVTSTGGILNASAMTGSDGQPIQTQGGTDKGLVGDIAKMRQQVMNDPSISAEDRAGVLAQLDSQAAQENKANADSVAGKTRKRTADEALKAAAEDSKVNDPVAYAAYESQIGKPLRDERRIENQDKRIEQQDTNTNRRLDIQQQFNENRAKYQDRLAEIAESRAQRMEDRTGAQMDKAEMQSTRQALSTVLKEIATSEDKIQMKLVDPALSPEQKTILENQFKTLDRDRSQVRNELLKIAGVELQKADIQEPSVKYDAQGRAYVRGPDGKPMLQSEASASKAPAKLDEPSTVAKPTNQAGYYDVQATIDGARRGDKKAMAYLQTLIDQGETTPAQRQQIAKITGQK